jgi:DNA (cytosine-5)-methyltransferase 1
VKITQLDLFSGIGGFHLGFERAGYKVKSYFSEVDKHAIAVYQHKFPNSTYVGSVTDVRGGDLPSVDLITFGSPCQDFSLAGKRKGMEGERSSLILEAIRLIGECRPRVFIWENVKGTFSSNAGEDFAAIIQAFANIGGYRLEWQLLNTSWFPRTPQNRERIYLVGYSTKPKRGWRGVFPIGEGNRNGISKRIEVVGDRGTGGQQGLIYGEDGIAPCITAHTFADPMKVKVKQVGTKLDSNGGTQPYQQDRVYDADGIVPALNQGKSDLIIKQEIGDYRSDVGKQKAQTLETSCNQAVIEPVIGIGIYGNNKETQYQKEVKISLALKASNQTNPRSGGTTLVGEKIVEPNYTYEAANELVRRNTLNEGEVKGLDFYNQSVRDVIPTLTDPKHNSQGLFDGYRIRRLTPIECERLQGFPDDHTAFGNYDGEVKPMSNTQRYKQCGNAVTVDVVQAVAEQCKPLFK